MKLGDLKGKVVVLDLLGHVVRPLHSDDPAWSEMVKRLKDKPFALVSISVDTKRKTLTDFLAKEPMPWNRWWNGREGKLIQTLGYKPLSDDFSAGSPGGDPLQGGPRSRTRGGRGYSA